MYEFIKNIVNYLFIFILSFCTSHSFVKNEELDHDTQLDLNELMQNFTPTPTPSPPDDNGLRGGEITGIVIGSVVGGICMIVITIIILYYLIVNLVGRGKGTYTV